MKVVKPLLAALCLAAFAVASPYADDAKKKESFSSLDKDNDGTLSRSEYEGGASAAVGGGGKKDDKASK